MDLAGAVLVKSSPRIQDFPGYYHFRHKSALIYCITVVADGVDNGLSVLIKDPISAQKLSSLMHCAYEMHVMTTALYLKLIRQVGYKYNILCSEGSL